ncbi:cytochrome P450 [Aquisalimonas sp.]|uniref:cytochrome P450 n=1 Tax=unclassified Aquisalimonas TaxID=2644645 RepID=UPI0025BE0117|nr:cytochrome P450 [Aquisalimonas sp.]
MTHSPNADWSPESDAVQRDQRAAYDGMRERCPVAHSKKMGWTLFRNRDIHRVLRDHETFSNQVSQHLSVPNGMDPPEHTAYRRIIEPYFDAAAMAAFEPTCRAIARDLAGQLRSRGAADFMQAFAQPFAVRVQCAFLGWPEPFHEPLRQWTQRNLEATGAQDRDALAEIADEFRAYVFAMIEQRRQASDGPDVTSRLMAERVDGKPLTDEEIASILRNWTMGEVGTLAAALGILVHGVATDRGLQALLRDNPARIEDANEELLRLHCPLVTNRRRATSGVDLHGRGIEAGDTLTLNWVAANRDPDAFEDAEQFRIDRDQSANLVWGAGIHVCPGAPLARLEMRVVIEELLAHSENIDLQQDDPPGLARYPGSGYATLPVRLC